VIKEPLWIKVKPTAADVRAWHETTLWPCPIARAWSRATGVKIEELVVLRDAIGISHRLHGVMYDAPSETAEFIREVDRRKRGPKP